MRSSVLAAAALSLLKQRVMPYVANAYFNSCGVTSQHGKKKIILNLLKARRNGSENCERKVNVLHAGA